PISCQRSPERRTTPPIVSMMASVRVWKRMAISDAIANPITPSLWKSRQLTGTDNAGTLVTALSVPVYWRLFHELGVMGLAIASDIAILFHTLTLAIMLTMGGVVRLSGLRWHEI